MSAELPLAEPTAAPVHGEETTETPSATGAARPGPSKTLTHSIFRLVAGRGAVIAVGLLMAPVLTRLYAPKDFGALALLTMIVGVLEGFTSLAYAGAMPLAESAAKRRALFVLSSLIGLAGTLILAIAVLLGAEWLAAVFETPDLAVYAWVIPLLFLALAMRNSINMVLGCEKKFGRVSIRNMVTSLGTTGTQIVAGLAGLAWSPAGLLWGTVVGWFAGSMVLSFSSIKALFRQSLEPFRPADVKSVAVEYRRFPLVELWSDTMNKTTLHLPMLIMGLLFAAPVVGLYAFSRKLVLLPTTLFTFSSSQVYYVEAAESVARGDSVASTTSELLRLLAVVTAFPFTVILILGPMLFEVVFGPPWREAGVFAMILVPWIAGSAIVSPLSWIFTAKRKSGERFAYNAVSLVARLLALLIGGLYFGAMIDEVWTARIALGCCSFATLAILACMLARALELAEVSRRKAALTLARSYAEAILLLAPAGVLCWGVKSNLGAIIALGVASAAYAALLHRRHPGVARKLKSIFSPAVS